MKLTLGILAHVDSGKTTLAEGILFSTGATRKLGRVDKKDTFLDTFELERERGITIFSKQACFDLDGMEVTMLDTPGHVDFGAEMERTLSVLDYAILVVNGNDGVQTHTETLWNLLEKYNIPTLIFVNKMDIITSSKEKVINEIHAKLCKSCFEVASDDFAENAAGLDEELIEQFFETGEIEDAKVSELISKRMLFPVYFGSALKLDGVSELLEGVSKYVKSGATRTDLIRAAFGAKVFRISRDDKGTRLTHLKVTSGTLKVKELLSNGEVWEEKVNEIRVYSGEKYVSIQEAETGSICAVTGLTQTFVGEGLGVEQLAFEPVLQPALKYKVVLPEGVDAFVAYSKLKVLSEEDPTLRMSWQEETRQIFIQLMGNIQVEVLTSIISKRFDLKVTFGEGNVVYKETIADSAYGVGHFEPLRHYAEVCLLLEPTKLGSGLSFVNKCRDGALNKNWQSQIMSSLKMAHVGVLTGSEMTDMRITLVDGNAHKTHTSGGDFIAATRRAVRQGLKMAESILLEPVFEFKLEVPTEMVGRAMTDIQNKNGKFFLETVEDVSILKGTVPVATMHGYSSEVASYSKNRGKLTVSLSGYELCHNPEEVIAKFSYDSELDVSNPTGSVFCANGSGFSVPWDEVYDRMHCEKSWDVRSEEDGILTRRGSKFNDSISTEEIDRIVNRAVSQNKNKTSSMPKVIKRSMVTEVNVDRTQVRKTEILKEVLIVDGYNMIFSWDELKRLSDNNIEAARDALIDKMQNYQAMKNCEVIIVFDAYKVKGGTMSEEKHGKINVVYTKEAETADNYIERIIPMYVKKSRVTVATSDGLHQIIILGKGALRMSASGLEDELRYIECDFRKEFLN